MFLHKRDGGAGGFDFGRLLYHAYVVLVMYGYRLVHCSHRCVTQCQTNNQPERYLPDNLDPSVESVFVVLEGLDIVIGKPESTKRHSSDKHQP